MKKIASVLMIMLSVQANAVEIAFSINENPVTDADITNRVKIMPASLNNRENAKNAIIDDYLKIEYAKTFKIEPTDKEILGAIKDKENKDNPQMKLFARATLAWQMTIMRTIVPTISVGEKEIKEEFEVVERDRGLPIEMVFLRLVNIPNDLYGKLTKPGSCESAQDMARSLGGEPQKITALQYELAPEVRSLMTGLPDLTWSKRQDKQVVLICSRKKTNEWGELDNIIKQNAIYKRALFNADQLLKQLRRKAAVTK